MSTSPTQVDRPLICRRGTLSVLVLVTLLSTGTLFGDRIELRTGEVFFGEILRANRREVSMRLESGGIVSFRMNQVAFFRKNFIASDEWIPSPFLVVDDPTLDLEPDAGPSFQGSPSSPIQPEAPAEGIVVGPATDLDPSLVRPAVEEQGFRVSPPRGFLDWEESDGSLIKRFYDPVTQAELGIVDLGGGDESLESVKTKTSRAHARNAATGLRVLRDERVRDSAFQGWYFEFQEDLTTTRVRRIWVFARVGKQTLLLKYSCPEQHYEELRRPFHESIRSFSPLETERAEPVAPTPPRAGPEKPPPILDPAEELLRLLRKKNRDASAIPDAVRE